MFFRPMPWPWGLTVKARMAARRSGRHGRAGVVEGQGQHAAGGDGAHIHMADGLTLLDAVVDGVFHQRLQSEVGQVPVFQVAFGRQGKNGAVFVAQLLDVDVAAGQLDVGGGPSSCPGG